MVALDRPFQSVAWVNVRLANRCGGVAVAKNCHTTRKQGKAGEQDLGELQPNPCRFLVLATKVTARSGHDDKAAGTSLRPSRHRKEKVIFDGRQADIAPPGECERRAESARPRVGGRGKDAGVPAGTTMWPALRAKRIQDPIMSPGSPAGLTESDLRIRIATWR